MADVSKLKKVRRLGSPPPVEEASSNLAVPEITPPPSTMKAGEYLRKDMRTARRTNRTLPFATRVSPEFDARIRAIAERDGLLLVEVMERALDAYEAQRHADK